MDLVIETLTGTVFELRVSPFETIMSVKAKIQRLEGIPMSQQHLIWQSLELEDDYCLHDYNIQDGTTLKLVLAMRGGPINTRRVSLEDPTIREMAEYMEANRDDIWESLMKDNRQVTLLVFRDGDQLNFFRVYDRGDGTLTPMSDTLSATSMYNMYDEGEDVAEMSVDRDKENGETKAKVETLKEEMAKLSLRRKEKEKENQQTKVKMELLRSEMARLNINKKPALNPRPPSTEKPSNNLARRRLKFAERMTYQRHRQQKETPKENVTDPPSLSEREEDKKSLPPVSLHRRLTDDVNVSDILATRNRDTKIIQDLNPLAPHPSEMGRLDSHTNNTNMGERIKRRTSNARQIAGRRPFVRNHAVGELCPDEATIAESEEELHVASTVNDSRLGNGSTSSRILRDLMMRNPSAEEHEAGSVDYRKSPVEGGSKSPEEQEDGRSLGQLWRGSKEYRDYRALISWIRPRSSAKQHSPIRGGSRVRFEAEVERSGSGRIVNDIAHVSRSRITPEDFAGPMPLPPKLPVTKRSSSGRDSTYALPPVSAKKRPPQLLATGRKKTRCSQCTKKLGLATSYQCRCGNVFCATHRYAETHNCTYDYKAEGKKMLEQSNPMVIAPKLPKI